jgi:phosphoserine phosphatase
VKMQGDVKEIKEVEEVRENHGKVAAFFDLDGTLMPLPSLERRLFRILRYRREIPLKNYFLWLREALRLLPRGMSAIAQANKMYLQGVQTFDESGTGNCGDSSAHKSGHQGEGRASTPPKRNPRRPVPRFFEEAIERAVCHAMLGHAIVIVSGTLEPLAAEAARALEAELAARGFATNICVCSTTLEEIDSRWTGRILGEAKFGEAKARAVRSLAEKMQFDLIHCWAYGDSARDRWLLAAVGHAAAVNPSRKLARIASYRGWPVLHWKEETNLAASSRGTQGTRRESVVAKIAKRMCKRA